MAALSQSAPGSRRAADNHLGVGRVALRRSGLMIVGVRAAIAVLLMLAPLAAARAGERCGDQRSAGAALCQRQGGPGQCPRRAGQGPRRFVGLHPRRLAGRNHRRVRELAAHPRLRRRRRLGLPFDAVGKAHRGGAAESEERSRAALRQARRAQRRRRRDCSPACSARSSSCTGTWCRFVGDGFDGWIAQDQLWGVYPDEKVE